MDSGHGMSPQDGLIEKRWARFGHSRVYLSTAGKFGFTGAITHRGVWCSNVKDAIGYAAWRGPVVGSATLKLGEEQRLEIAEKLSRAFPSC